MARRDLLHFKHVPEFIKWMDEFGYERVPCKGEWEHLRFQKRGGTRKVIVFERLRAKHHLTVRDVDRSFVHEFLRQRFNPPTGGKKTS